MRRRPRRSRRTSDRRWGRRGRGDRFVGVVGTRPVRRRRPTIAVRRVGVRISPQPLRPLVGGDECGVVGGRRAGEGFLAEGIRRGDQERLDARPVAAQRGHLLADRVLVPRPGVFAREVGARQVGQLRPIEIAQVQDGLRGLRSHLRPEGDRRVFRIFEFFESELKRDVEEVFLLRVEIHQGLIGGLDDRAILRRPAPGQACPRGSPR